MKLVRTWLRGIGLQAHSSTFEAAGITTPSALAELEVSHFEALGVKNEEERRKLFFLVQRVKKELAENKTVETNEVKEAGAVKRPKSPNKKVEAAFEKKQESTGSHRSTGNLRTKSIAQPVQARSRPNTRSRSKVQDTDDDELDNLLRNSTDDDSLSKSEADEAIVEKYLSFPVETAGTATSEKTQPSAVIAQPRSKIVPSTTKRRSLVPAPTDQTLLPKARSGISRMSLEPPSRSLSSGSSADSSERSRLRSSTGGSRVSESRLTRPSSMRTGKQLSAIPSNKIAPMSPLVELPQTSKLLQADSSNQDLSERLLNRGRRRATSIGQHSRGSSLGNESDSGNMSDVSSQSSSHRRRSLSDSRLPRPPTSTTNGHSLGSKSGTTTRLSVGAHTLMREPILRSRQSLGGRTKSDLSSRQSLPSSLPTVTFQGQKEDDSFKAQIKRLREAANAEYMASSKNGIRDDTDMRIRVVIRKRPMSKGEVSSAGDVDVIHPLDYGSFGKILVYQPKTRVDLTKEIDTLPFAFDNVFDESSTNRQLYERCVRHLIPSLFEEEHCGVSIFAYGQTGSGKTYTMLGSSLTGLNDGSSVDSIDNIGLYYMASLDIFHMIKDPEFAAFSVTLSLFEIYGGKLFDLLNDRVSIKCLEDHRGRVNFPGLSEHEVSGPEYLLDLINLGAANRSTGSTSRNADSSRSHAIMQIHINKPGSRGRKVEHSRLTIVDLAGSERGADTANASRATRLEGAEINTSLLALKEVIRAMATGDSMVHVPFRGSKLTQVLKESFVGPYCRSIMIGCISPNIGNCEQTLNTLPYADRVKERDSSTGFYNGRADLPSFQPPTNRTMPKIASVTESSFTDGSSLGDRDENESASQENSAASDMLEDLLSSPSAKAQTSVISPEDGISERDSDGEQAARDAARDMINSHKEAMTSMLDMLKDEMDIVNQVDCNHEGFDEYINRVKDIQERQLVHIVTIREHLLQYHAARNSASLANLHAASDDSFEDLRD